MSNWHIIADQLGGNEATARAVHEYLHHYGYLCGNVLSGAVNPADARVTIAEAVANVQTITGRPATGELDADTYAAMCRPRCGCLDVQRSLAESLRWRKQELTYTVERYVNRLSQSTQDDIFEAAFAAWESVAAIKITRVIGGSRADITISAGSGPSDNFDGPSGVLAWAYMPTGQDSPLQMKFDLAEPWTHDATAAGVLLLNVACHEFGHLLGLEHSRNPKALMAPYYSPAISVPQADDDIPRIRALYGPAGPAAPQPPTSPPIAPGRKVVIFEIAGDIEKIMCPGDTITKNR